MTPSRFDVTSAGFSGDTATARAGLSSADAPVRASALRALARLGELNDAEIAACLRDENGEVRRTAAELSASHPAVDVRALLQDTDVFVAEMAAWAIGERPGATDEAIDTLIESTTAHSEVLVREACAAALGSIGNPRGLDAVLAACTDKPTVRRRAVLALAPFDDPRAEAALRDALGDRDWQVRQNAEDVLNPRF